MTPLDINIIAGQKDAELLRIIDDLERMKKLALSPGEENTLRLAYARLEEMTKPEAA